MKREVLLLRFSLDISKELEERINNNKLLVINVEPEKHPLYKISIEDKSYFLLSARLPTPIEVYSVVGDTTYKSARISSVLYQLDGNPRNKDNKQILSDATKQLDLVGEDGMTLCSGISKNTNEIYRKKLVDFKICKCGKKDAQKLHCQFCGLISPLNVHAVEKKILRLLRGEPKIEFELEEYDEEIEI